jgi:hypothetical protein
MSMTRLRYDITRTADLEKIRTFVANCRRAGDEEGVQIGHSHLFRLLAEQGARDFGRDLMNDPLVIRFMQMIVAVEELRGTRASRTRNALKAGDDKLGVIERLLRQWARRGARPQDGTETFQFLNNAGRLDLSGEALLLEFRARFTSVDAQAIAEARERLAHFGYQPAVELLRQHRMEVEAERSKARAGVDTVAAKLGLVARDATIAAVAPIGDE